MINLYFLQSFAVGTLISAEMNDLFDLIFRWGLIMAAFMGLYGRSIGRENFGELPAGILSKNKSAIATGSDAENVLSGLCTNRGIGMDLGYPVDIYVEVFPQQLLVNCSWINIPE